MLMQFQEFDRSYMDRLRSGDFQTEVHFVNYFGELIRMKAIKRLRSTAEVDDIQQETLTRVLRNVQQDRIQQPERLGAFVNTVCENVLREHCQAVGRPYTDIEKTTLDTLRVTRDGRNGSFTPSPLY